MRYILMHKTNAHWESGVTPGPKLIERVGSMVGELIASGKLVSADGLRATSKGARVRWANGDAQVSAGPYAGDNELVAGFSVVQAAELATAVDWAKRQARVLGETENGDQQDVRPVTEAWDIGLAPKPDNLTTQRYMVLRKGNRRSEAGTPGSEAQAGQLDALRRDTSQGATHLTTVTLKPSARGRRYKNSDGGLSIIDGPFAESKEMIAGYLLIECDSAQEASTWAERYLDVVSTHEVDLREVDAVIA